MAWCLPPKDVDALQLTPVSTVKDKAQEHIPSLVVLGHIPVVAIPTVEIAVLRLIVESVGRPESSDSDRSASPQANPVLNGIGLRQTGHSSSGDLSATSIVVGAVGDVVNSDAAVSRLATATELALRVIPLINSLKVQLGEVQLALDVLPAF